MEKVAFEVEAELLPEYTLAMVMTLAEIGDDDLGTWEVEMNVTGGGLYLRHPVDKRRWLLSLREVVIPWIEAVKEQDEGEVAGSTAGDDRPGS